MTTLPAILQDDIGLMNFTLVKGVNKGIKADYTVDPLLDISGWAFEISFYVGRPAVKTVIISSVGGGIGIDAVGQTIVMTFSAASIAALAPGPYQWDLQFTTLAGEKGQLLKGTVTLGVV